jgi:Tfp pilus assembly protein PilF
MKTMTDADELANAKQELSMLRQQLELLKKMGGMLNNAQGLMQAAGMDIDAEELIVPKKNTAKIAAIPATPAAAAMPAYLQKLQTAIAAKIAAADKAEADKLLQAAGSSVHAANAAVGLWMGKMPLQALYVMSKAAVADASNPNTLNNYASMLSMAGAEQLALPILQRLNQQYPRNSTILNNIGQAWLGLGDLLKAEQYLDSAIRIYPGHSQANLAKANIAESKGNTKAAAEAIRKSLDESFSSEKLNRLRKYGQPYNGNNIRLPSSMPADALGLESFNWPAYPGTVDQSVELEKAWAKFREQCDKESAILNTMYERLQEQALQEQQERDQALLNYHPLSGAPPPQPLPTYAEAASIKLRYYIDDKDGGQAYRLGKLQEALLEAQEKVALLEEKRREELEAVQEKYDPLIGEGKPNPLEAYCSEYNSVNTRFLGAANPILQNAYSDWLEENRKRLNNEMYFYQYIQWPTQFEASKLHAKMFWLSAIASQTVQFASPGPFCKARPIEDKKPKPLPEFDDIACQYNSSMDLGVFQITSNCSRLTGHLKMGPLDYSRKVDTDKDILLAASLEITAGVSKGWEKGPVAAEAKAEVTGKVEWNDKQITNWTVTADAGVSVGSNLGYGDKSIEIAGATAQIGMNSGPSLSGRGLLQGVQIK